MSSLSLAETYLVVATLVANFDFELVDTTYDDIKIARDFLSGVPGDPYAGLKARVHALRA